MSSRGFRCDPWAPVSDLCWACIFGRERLVQKLASSLPHLAALHDASAVCFPFWQFDLEEAKKVQKMFHGLCGDIGAGVAVHASSEEGNRGLHRATSGHWVRVWISGLLQQEPGDNRNRTN